MTTWSLHSNKTTACIESNSGVAVAGSHVRTHQVAFPSVTHVMFYSKDEVMPVVPDSFMGGSALDLNRVPFPELLKPFLTESTFHRPLRVDQARRRPPLPIRENRRPPPIRTVLPALIVRWSTWLRSHRLFHTPNHNLSRPERPSIDLSSGALNRSHYCWT